jgi:hypothetical protein
LKNTREKSLSAKEIKAEIAEETVQITYRQCGDPCTQEDIGAQFDRAVWELGYKDDVDLWEDEDFEEYNKVEEELIANNCSQVTK